MRYDRVSLIILIVAMLVAPAFAQKPWERDSRSWDRDDALRIINDSPWAKAYTSPNSAAEAEKANAQRELNTSVFRGGSDPKSTARTAALPPVTALLHSARVVREAIVRLRKLAPEYANLSGAEKKAFDDQQTAYIEKEIYQSFYVVSFTKAPDSTLGQVDEGIFQRTTLAEVKGNVWLQTDSGEKLELFQFTAPKGAGGYAYFFFKRLNDAGEPFIKPRTKSFKLVFSNDFLTAKNPYTPYIPRNFEFSVGKLMIGDKIDF